MKKLMLLVMALVLVSPVMAEEKTERKAQCEAWAQEDGLQGKEAKEFIDYCMEEAQGSLAPESAN